VKDSGSPTPDIIIIYYYYCCSLVNIWGIHPNME